MWAFLKRHRTKVLGGIQVGLGAVMTYLPGLQANVKPVHYGLATMAIGVTTTVLGFINSATQEKSQ